MGGQAVLQQLLETQCFIATAVGNQLVQLPVPAIHFSTAAAVVNPPAVPPVPVIHFSTATAAVNQPDHRGSFKVHHYNNVII